MPLWDHLTEKLTDVLELVSSAFSKLFDFFLFPKGTGKPPPGPSASAERHREGKSPHDPVK